ncbi:unnamed protein product [Rotaria sp. Silwood2]|nr:unnamed protein product [Rotaria sp. Silwood2]CAF4749332.1 unnamed protein product [Rotaria sp. Silwood2]
MFFLFLVVQDFLLLTCLFSIRVIEFNRDSNIEALSAIVPDQSTIISDPVFNYEEKFGYFYFQRTQMICSSKMDSDKSIPVTTSKVFPLVSAMAFDCHSKLIYMTLISENQIIVEKNEFERFSTMYSC